LSQEIDQLADVANEIARRHFGVSQHSVEWCTRCPAHHGTCQTPIGPSAAPQPESALISTQCTSNGLDGAQPLHHDGLSGSWCIFGAPARLEGETRHHGRQFDCIQSVDHCASQDLSD
jgi:hypothetical protein